MMSLDYPFLNLLDIDTIPSSSGIPPTSDIISTSNPVSSSFFTRGVDTTAPNTLPTGGWAGSTYGSPQLYVPTPENSPRSYQYYPTPHMCSPSNLVPTLPPVRDFLHGSSLEESPISSPGDVNTAEREHIQPIASMARDCSARIGVNRSPTPLSRFGMAAQSGFESVSSGEDDSSYSLPSAIQLIPEGVKMPQRKGGMQLWQFLYSMLTDPDGKYKNLIEWTQTAKERQFRLLEPDAIAVWWGHHKNKPNMSYDKLSRSLRYYYDKGIIRKISGERFVYRFCIDPEVMYKHMGTSHSRPKLKPMPQDAKVSLGKNHNMANASHGIAKEPESLVLMKASSQMPPILPPPYPTTSYSHTIATTNSYSAPILCMRRSHSYDSTYQHTNTTPESSPTPCPSSFPTFYKSNSNSPPLASPPQSMALEYPPFSAESSGLAPATSAHYSDFSLYSNHEPCFNPSTTPSSLFY